MTIERAYYLACELSPTLPDHKLLRLLPGKYVELITSAATNGISSGLANYDQLAKVYEAGAKYGIEPTEQEFRSLMTEMLREGLESKQITLHERLKLMAKLVRYYEQGQSIIPQVRRKFSDKAPPTATFTSGFLPLDTVLDNKIVNSVITIVAQTGTGKSFITYAIALAWQGPVLFYDPENGEALMLSRSNGNPRNSDDKEFVFGWYDAEQILDELREDPNPDLLVIMDSMHVVCGDARDPATGARYYKHMSACSAMKQYAKLIINTTQIKRGGDGDSVDAASGSSNVEHYTGALIHLSKGGVLDDGSQLYRMYCPKNRNGVSGLECKFAFDYSTATCKRIIETPIPTAYKPQDIDEMEYYDG